MRTYHLRVTHRFIFWDSLRTSAIIRRWWPLSLCLLSYLKSFQWSSIIVSAGCAAALVAPDRINSPRSVLFMYDADPVIRNLIKELLTGVGECRIWRDMKYSLVIMRPLRKSMKGRRSSTVVLHDFDEVMVLTSGRKYNVGIRIGANLTPSNAPISSPTNLLTGPNLSYWIQNMSSQIAW